MHRMAVASSRHRTNLDLAEFERPASRAVCDRCRASTRPIEAFKTSRYAPKNTRGVKAHLAAIQRHLFIVQEPHPGKNEDLVGPLREEGHMSRTPELSSTQRSTFQLENLARSYRRKIDCSHVCSNHREQPHTLSMRPVGSNAQVPFSNRAAGGRMA